MFLDLITSIGAVDNAGPRCLTCLGKRNRDRNKWDHVEGQDVYREAIKARP